MNHAILLKYCCSNVDINVFGWNDPADRIYEELTKLLLERANDDRLDAVKYVLDNGFDLNLVDEAFEKAAMGIAVVAVDFLWNTLSFAEFSTYSSKI